MKIGGIRQGLDLVREVDIGAIQRLAETPVTVLIVGDDHLTARLQAAVEAPIGERPARARVRRLAAPLPVGLEVARPTVALLVTDGTELHAGAAKARQQLGSAGIPTVEVALSDAVWAPPATPVPVPGQRLWLPAQPDAETVSAQLGAAVANLDPENNELLLPLARQLPVFSDAYIQRLIEEVSRVNAWYAFSSGLAQTVPLLGLPMALADVVILTKNQLVMAFKIALAAGKPATGKVLLGEVVTVIGGGLLFRQIARELVGLVPGIGLLPKVVIAYAGTRVVGQVVRVWALEGRPLEGREIGHLYQAAVEGGRKVAAEFQARAGAIRKRGAREPRALPPPQPYDLPPGA